MLACGNRASVLFPMGLRQVRKISSLAKGIPVRTVLTSDELAFMSAGRD